MSEKAHEYMLDCGIRVHLQGMYWYRTYSNQMDGYGNKCINNVCKNRAMVDVKALWPTLPCAADEPILQWQFRGLKERLQERWLSVGA